MYMRSTFSLSLHPPPSSFLSLILSVSFSAHLSLYLRDFWGTANGLLLLFTDDSSHNHTAVTALETARDNHGHVWHANKRIRTCRISQRESRGKADRWRGWEKWCNLRNEHELIKPVYIHTYLPSFLNKNRTDFYCFR